VPAVHQKRVIHWPSVTSQKVWVLGSTTAKASNLAIYILFYSDKGSLELHQSQQQAAELSQQVSELQRCVTDERFERARREEECRR